MLQVGKFILARALVGREDEDRHRSMEQRELARGACSSAVTDVGAKCGACNVSCREEPCSKS